MSYKVLQFVEVLYNPSNVSNAKRKEIEEQNTVCRDGLAKALSEGFDILDKSILSSENVGMIKYILYKYEGEKQ